MLDLSCDCIYAQVTGVQLESPEVFMGGEPAQGDPVSVYYFSTELEARWITGYMWISLWSCRNVWVSAKVSRFDVYRKTRGSVEILWNLFTTAYTFGLINCILLTWYLGNLIDPVELSQCNDRLWVGWLGFDSRVGERDFCLLHSI